MKKIKGILALILCLSLMLTSLTALTACNGDGGGEETDGETESELVKEPDTVYKEDLSKYSFVIPKGIGANLKAVADNLLETINSKWRTEMTMVTDEASEPSEYEILLGNTNREETKQFSEKVKTGECGYGVIGRKIVIFAEEEYHVEKAVSIFVSLELFSTRNMSVKIIDSNRENIVDVSNMISAMSLNLRVGHGATMQGAVSKVLKTYMPDLLGVQEADSEWMGALRGRLGKNGYAAVGLGRDSDDTGERTAIFYRTDTLELIDTATFWLTDTPNEVSRVEGSECNRIVTVATFKRISDGKEFAFASTHLDHSNAAVREEQMRHLYAHLTSFTDLPHLLVGDFNCSRSEGAYKAATEEFGYENCSILAKEARGRANATFVAGGLIDYCLRSANSPFEPYLYAVCTEQKNNKTVSDHYPILVMAELK